jgi:hypothetical protein
MQIRFLVLFFVLFIGAEFRTEGVTERSCNAVLEEVAKLLRSSKIPRSKRDFYLAYYFATKRVNFGDSQIILSEEELKKHNFDFIEIMKVISWMMPQEGDSFSTLFAEILTEKGFAPGSDQAEKLRTVLFQIFDAIRSTYSIFTSHSTDSLRGEKWLDTEIIQSMLKELTGEKYNCFMLPVTNDIKTQDQYIAWAIHYYANKNHETFVVVPYNHNNSHWTCAVFSIKWNDVSKMYEIAGRTLDSLGGYKIDLTQALTDIFAPYKFKYNYKCIDQKDADGKPIQKDAYNCGIFTIFNAFLFYQLVEQLSGAPECFDDIIEILRNKNYSKNGLTSYNMQLVLDALEKMLRSEVGDKEIDKEMAEAKETLTNFPAILEVSYAEIFNAYRKLCIGYLRTAVGCK